MSSECIECRDQDAEQHRKMKQQVERDGGAQNLGQIARDDGDFTEDPESDVDWSGIGFAACLRQIAARNDSQAGAESLEQDGDGIGDYQDPEQPVSETGAAEEVGGPVARIHVTDADQVGRSAEGKDAAPQSEMRCADGPMDFAQGSRHHVSWIG